MIKKTEKKEKSMIDEYIEILHNYQDKYGNKIALLYQVGSFMELYAIKNSDGLFIENPELEKITAICNLSLVEKKQVYCGRNENSGAVYMAGVRDYIIEKYLSILSDAGYTSIVYIQEKQGSGFIRKLECIVSCGTHITYETYNSDDNLVSNTSNYIMCIWIEKINKFGVAKSSPLQSQLLIGLSTTNIFTGKTYFFEYTTQYNINPTNFDELERQVSTFSPNEIIFISNLKNNEIQNIVNFSNIKCSLIHYIDIDNNEKAQNCMKQKYIQHTFSSYLRGGENILQTCIEFQTNLIATQSFCFLLDFIHEHNPNLIKNIMLPIIQNTSVRMILGNQTLKQLNIIEDGSIDNKRVGGGFSSVLNFLNKTCSPMGKRLFHHQLVNPVFDEDWLCEQYSMINECYIENEEFVGDVLIDKIRKNLCNIKDIEKIGRQIIIRKIFPCSLYTLYNSLKEICYVYNFIKIGFLNSNKIIKWAEKNTLTEEKICELIKYLDNHLFIDICKTSSSITIFENNIFRPNIFPELDNLTKKYEKYKTDFQNIYEYLNKLISTEEKDTLCVKIHETDKNGLSFQITKRRGIVLKKLLDKGEHPSIIEGIKLISAGSGSNEEITSPQIREICKNISMYKDKLNSTISIFYFKFLEELEKEFYDTIVASANTIANIDVLMCKAYISKKYNYCCPILCKDTEQSFVSAKNLRHVLIEHINTNEIYVPNDVCIGISNDNTCDIKNSTNGILIYGVNTTGKTSYIRSVGIAIIMAQSGMYVPAQNFKYKPYKSIFSRILGNDNLFHGLSTFAVEMSELRVILKMADKYTLVIGDEVCSGTENQSALSIFVAALMKLYETKCSFLFATHFHEIIEYEEIQKMLLECLKIKHMSVIYDREKDSLIYERKLRDGAGYRMYGIEICKSLHLADDFIECAYKLRNKYYKDTVGALSHKTSVYNTEKIRGLCEKCKINLSQETHHISPQKNASINGFIDNGNIKFHKNHLQNLMALCEKCHDEEHS